MRGRSLQALRYGPETERIVADALQRELWTSDQWKRWQEERLSFILHRAATQVPYYRALWDERRRKGDRTSCEYLENWPLLDKDAVRNNVHAFIADDCNVRKMHRDTTSGSTGKPVNVWFSRNSVRLLYGLFEARVRRWHGVSLEDRWAIAGGQLVTPFAQVRPPFWVWSASSSQLYLSSYHLRSDFISHYVDALRKYKVKYVYGYTSSLYALARELCRLGSEPLRLKVAVTNAEPLTEHQRDTITRAFGCPVVETYGMSEVVAFSSECPHGGMHLWPEVGHVEVHSQDASGTGELVCTSLLNPDMPLIRYRVGDRGRQAPETGMCACGRSLPLFGGVEGRLDDVLYAPDGRPVGRMDPMFKGELPLRESQIIQEALDRIRIRYVPESGFNADHGRILVHGVRDRMGAVQVILDPVGEIPRGANAKFKAVVCQLTPQDIQRAQEALRLVPQTDAI
jgi:phenylacetate-CoA ligase